MKRRNLLAALVAGALGLGLAGCSQEQDGATSSASNNNENAASASTADKKVYKWKMVTTWPKNFPGLGTAPEHFAERVRAMTDGQIDITVYGAGDLVPALEVFSAVSQGTAEMGHGAGYYWKARSLPVSSSLPFRLV